MSLYDGLDIDAKPKVNNSDLSGWGSSLKLLETQKQLQAKKSQLQNLKKKVTSTSLAPVIDLKGRRNEEPSATQASGSFRFNQHTGKVYNSFNPNYALERTTHSLEHVPRPSGGLVPMGTPFIGSDAPLGAGSFLGVTDEYDPLRPNDYENFVKLRKAERQKERELERSREEKRIRGEDSRDREKRRRAADNSDDEDDDYDRRRSRNRRDDDDRRRSDDGEFDRRRRRREEEEEEEEDDRRSKRSGAAIAPPPSLLDLDVKPTEGFSSTLENPNNDDSKEAEQIGSKFGLAGSVASKIMARMGYKTGQGLGKSEQGMSIALQVEKTGRRAGKIIHEKDLLKGAQAAEEEFVDSPSHQSKPGDSSNANLLKNPSKVIVLRNMVGPGEVDDDLEGETAEECSKFGKVSKCLIFELSGVEAEEAVRIFLEFERMESAIKALVDLNGRFFGGRVVRANFYNLDRFRRLDLGGEIE